MDADPGRDKGRSGRRCPSGDGGAGPRCRRAVDRRRAACRGRGADPGRGRRGIRRGPLGVVPARPAGHCDRQGADGSGVLCPPGPPGRGRWTGRAAAEARSDTPTVRTRLLGGASAYHRLRHRSLRQVGGPVVGSAASAADAAGRLDRRRRDPAGHRRHPDAPHRRPSATRWQSQTGVVVDLGRRPVRGRAGRDLGGVAATLRHRAHVPIPQTNPRMDYAQATDARAGRCLDLAGHRRLHAARTRPHPCRRSALALGSPGRTRHVDPDARAPRVWKPPPGPGLPGPCSETVPAWARPPTRPSQQPTRTRLRPWQDYEAEQKPGSRHEVAEGHRTINRFKDKLRACLRWWVRIDARSWLLSLPSRRPASCSRKRRALTNRMHSWKRSWNA